MLRNTRIQMAAVLAAGALLGYLAASGKLNPFSRADAAPSSERSTTTRTDSGSASAACCDQLNKGQLLALADPKPKANAATAQEGGKKPNILFIMGDDIGWFQIGAYHRGIMS